MEFPVTVVAGTEEHDVMATCSGADSVSGLVRAVLGWSDPAGEVFVDGRPVSPETRIGQTAMIGGSVVSVGARDPRREGGPPPAGSCVGVVGGLSAGGLAALGSEPVTFGRQRGCDLYVDDDEVSRLHAALSRRDGDAAIEDLGSSNGTTLNGVGITGAQRLDPGDMVEAGGTVLTVMEAPAGRAADVETTDDGRLRFNKPPRQRQPLEAPTFEIPRPPPEVSSRPFNLVVILIPLALGLVLFFVLKTNPAYLAFSVMSPMMVGANVWSERHRGRRSRSRAATRYDKELEALSQKLRQTARDQERALRHAVPDPATVAAIVSLPGERLWERQRHDDDFLLLRLGLGSAPARVHFAGTSAPPADLPLGLDLVPVTIPLADAGVVGYAGPRRQVLAAVRAAVLHLAALHAPGDLSMCLLSAKGSTDWEWLKWLPHMASGGRPGRCQAAVMAEQRRTRIDDLLALVERRAASHPERQRAAGAWPSVLVIIDGASVLRREKAVASLLRDGPEVGVVAICVADDRNGLPAETRATIDISLPDVGPAVARLTDNAGNRTEFLPDGVGTDHALRTARMLTPLYEVGHDQEGSLPEPPLDHLEVLGLESLNAAAILDEWDRSSGPGHLPAVIGVGVDSRIDLDLAVNGPHVLIAGTTGSGKSALLQTLVASMAVATPPDRLNFLLVDFKGGSAFSNCEALPHTLGVISNLDGRLVERALDSLQAELRWRQQQFAIVGAKDLEQYQILARNRAAPMSRLVVVVDELFELVEAYADSIVRLNQVARLGNSLGVHLVLATQRPRSVQGLADLRANTDIRISLRAQEGAESQDVIGVPDAETIPRASVGRGFVRFGGGDLVMFQTGFLGGPATGLARPAGHLHVRPWDLVDVDISDNDPDGPAPDETALRRLVATIGEAAATLRLPEPHRPWLPPLPEVLTLDDPPVRGRSQDLAVVFGLMDLPEQQRREPLVLDLDVDHHLLVIGPARSGRTTTLRTLAGAIGRSIAIRNAHLYVLDFRHQGLSDIEALPHCGALLGLEDPERLERFIGFLESELARRARTMGGMTSLAEQRRSGQGPALPHIVVLADNFEAFHERFAYEDSGRMLDRFFSLVSDGPARGIHFVITLERRTALAKLGASITARLVLRPVERDDQLALGLRGVPTDLPPGRGYWYQGPSEVQVCLLDPSRSGQAQSQAMAAIAALPVPPSDRPFGPVRVPPLPETVTLEHVAAIPRRKAGGPAVDVGLGGVEAGPATVTHADLARGFLVAGPRASGRSTALFAIATGLRSPSAPVPLVVVALRRSPLERLTGTSGVTVLRSSDTLAADLLQAASAPGPLAVIVDDAELLLDHPAAKQLERLVRDGPDIGISVIAAGTTTDLGRRYSGWAHDLRQSRTGIVLQPASPTDGEILDIRLPRTTTYLNAPPGRGVLVIRGVWSSLQVAAPGS